MVTPIQGSKNGCDGDKGMIVFADVLENEKLMYYNHNIRWKGELPQLKLWEKIYLILIKNHFIMNANLYKMDNH